MKLFSILKRGLTKLRDQIQSRKAKLIAELKAGQPISEVDEVWLDDDGNLVDEEQVVETLDNASDYDWGVERLNSQDKGIVQKLQRLGGGDAPSRKHKHKDLEIFVVRNPSAKFHKKENATLAQQIEILDWYHANGKNQKQMAAHFNKIYPSLYLKQLRISVWLQDEAKWQAEYEGNANLSRSAKKMLDLWVSKAMADNILLTGKTFADLIGVPDDEHLNLSEGWLSWFKAASAASEIVEEEWLHIQELIKKHGYQPRDIFNADESSLFYV
ncbi:hypothetical protein BKA83DRAFT_4465217 [Pisolithus microcarpus]|nr:hypothetical protein BKA83DRAFT_4465217 [Pisolithus microcarpus]